MLPGIHGAVREAAKGRYSPAEWVGITKNRIEGDPDPAHVSTSYVERHNLTMRMHMRRFTRLAERLRYAQVCIDNVYTEFVYGACQKMNCPNRRETMQAVAIKRTATRARRDTTINLRIPAQTRDLFDAAAEAVGKTRTQFVVDSARLHAMDVLLDKRVFKLSETAFGEFCAVLDNPAEPTQKLKELFARKAPWET